MLHDPCAVAALIDPSIIRFEPMHVAIELKGEHTTGMTVCDDRYLRGTGRGIVARDGARTGDFPNAKVAVRIDSARFIELLIESVAKYP